MLLAQGHTHEADYAAFTTRQSHQLKQDVQVGHNNVQTYTGIRYIIKAKNDNIQQFGPTIGPGLSATDGTGAQTTTLDLSSTEIGMKVDETQFKFDGSNKLTLRDPSSLTSPILGEFHASQACTHGCLIGPIPYNEDYLRDFNRTTSCLNYTEGGQSFVCIGDGNVPGLTYYPEDSTASKACAKICFQQPGIYRIKYGGLAPGGYQTAHLCANLGSAAVPGKDICGNIIASSQVNERNFQGLFGLRAEFDRTILVDQPGCAFILHRNMENACPGHVTTGYAGQSRQISQGEAPILGGTQICAIYADLTITKMNHFSTSMTPTTAAMTSFFA